MKDQIAEILREYTDAFGFCSFSSIENYLINCRNCSEIPEHAQSIIALLFPYYLGEQAYRQANVSRYAVVPDYHAVVSTYLEKIIAALKDHFPSDEFVCFIDNSPIPEVCTASLCGLGCVGKNGLLINEKYGSWVFIGEIVTTLKIDESNRTVTSCIGCDQCVEACPTGVLSGGNFDRNFCLSHITQKKGEIPKEYEDLMIKYHCAWGCDICQKVCPMNQKAQVTFIKEFCEQNEAAVAIGSDIKGRAFAWRGEKVIKRNLKILDTDKKE